MCGYSATSDYGFAIERHLDLHLLWVAPVVIRSLLVKDYV